MVDKTSGQSQLPTTLLALEGMASYRRIEEAFHCKLRGPVVVDKKTLTELQNFQTVSVTIIPSLWNVLAQIECTVFKKDEFCGR